MKQPAINPPITFEWNGIQCVVINNNMPDIVLCMRAGTTSGVFSVQRSAVPEILAHVPSMMEEMQNKYKVKSGL